MELDPHTLHQILDRIHKQMRCPQCGNKVPIDLSNVQVVVDTGVVLHLFCEGCNAHIVLQASLNGLDNISAPPYEEDVTRNASSAFSNNGGEVKQVREVLSQDVSFTEMFKEEDVETKEEF